MRRKVVHGFASHTLAANEHIGSFDTKICSCNKCLTSVSSIFACALYCNTFQFDHFVETKLFIIIIMANEMGTFEVLFAIKWKRLTNKQIELNSNDDKRVILYSRPHHLIHLSLLWSFIGWMCDHACLIARKKTGNFGHTYAILWYNFRLSTLPRSRQSRMGWPCNYKKWHFSNLNVM